jgi:hypothetical protein
MGRKQRVSEAARKTTVFLSPADELALQVIELRRRKRGEERDSPSEIVSDALWKFLTEAEGVPRSQIEALLPEDKPDTQQSNVRKFPK